MTTESGDVLAAARRVFGATAEVHYGVREGGSWATAGVAIDAAEDKAANELSVWGPNALGRLLACLRALPETSP